METLQGYEALVVRRINDVLFVTLNQPATRNALGTEMLDELSRVLAIAEQDTAIRALALRGAGSVFCAGGNIGGFQKILLTENNDVDPIALRNRQFGYFMDRLTSLPVPVLAMVEGAAMGGGMGLACAADFVLATEKARFALSETSLGIIAAQITPFVVTRLGAATTRRLGLSGERISGDLALRLGMLDDIAKDSEQLNALEAEWLTRICRCAPKANRAFKPLVNRSTTEPFAPLLDEAATLFAKCLRDEGGEGTQAFREKRDASWCVQFDAASIQAAHNVVSALSSTSPQGSVA
ncbi:enoyl-CoA hydratase/isomerase family protein [Alcaligenaceae bacterium]|nr:enoyl-CoA hydratase/isomerase family protein [Alcaligenaceae bacterium]